MEQRREQSRRSSPNAGQHKEVLTVVERDGKSYWTKVGAAFENRDGSWSVVLDAIPVNGRLQIREPFKDRPRGDRPRRNQ